MNNREELKAHCERWHGANCSFQSWFNDITMIYSYRCHMLDVTFSEKLNTSLNRGILDKHTF